VVSKILKSFLLTLSVLVARLLVELKKSKTNFSQYLLNKKRTCGELYVLENIKRSEVVDIYVYYYYESKKIYKKRMEKTDTSNLFYLSWVSKIRGGIRE
jgi:hypothetical protein